MRGIATLGGAGLLGAGGLLGACLPAGTFECAESAQCTLHDGGTCQAEGLCSYPDGRCESGQRYGDFGGVLAGVCVPPGNGSSGGSSSSTDTSTGTSTGTGTSSDSGSDSGSSGGIPSGCEAVSCSDRGTCVMVDDAPTCACEPGLYAVGLACEDDPCEAVSCRFVDATLGDDAADGSRRAPWQTLDRLEDALLEAAPGDHFLLRRGETWAESLDVLAAAGSIDAPLVIGAYGPLDGAAPRILPGAVHIANSEHVVLRDLWIEGDPDAPEPGNSPCVLVDRSSHVLVWGNTVARCLNRGIRVNDDSTYTVIADNVVRDVIVQAGIFVADASWQLPEPTTIGAHHWIIGNVVTGIASDGIAVDASDATTDVKVIDNVVDDVTRFGVSITASGWAWAVGNVVARASDDTETIGGGLRFAAEGPVSGNVVLQGRQGLELRGEGTVSHNTVVLEADGTAALVVDEVARDLDVHDNLVLARGGAPWLRLPGPDLADDVAAMDRDWYATDGEPCVLELQGMPLELPAFVAATGLGAGSSCDPVPGFGAVPSGLPPARWDAAFWAALVPDAGWARCDDPAGARDCDGTPLGGEVQPIATFPEDGGRGWAGPLLVRQRYDASP